MSSATDYVAASYNAVTWDKVSERRRDGQVVGYSYDARHRVTSKDAPATSYGYDLLDRTTAWTAGGISVGRTYDAMGRMTAEAGPLGSVGYLYDLDGRRTQLTWPDGTFVTSVVDGTGLVTSLRENGAASGPGVLASFAYDAIGRRMSLTRGNGGVTSYGYDGVSRLAGLTHDLAGTANDQTLTFGYNAASQILSRTSSNPAYAWAGLSTFNRPYTPNGLNQLTTAGAAALSYDGRGNLTHDGTTGYGYDIDNRLISASSGAALSYDPTSRLYQTTSAGGAVTRFLYDGPEIIGEYSAAGVLQRRYVHGPNVDEPLVWYEGSVLTDRRWLAADQQGSVVAVTNGAGAVLGLNTYDEYGVPGAGNLGRFQYTGQIWVPELGLYHYKARAYSASLGRFMQTDPIGYRDNLNLYAYVKDDPVDGRDPSGLCIEDACVAEGAFIIFATTATQTCIAIDCVGKAAQGIREGAKALVDFARSTSKNEEAKPEGKGGKTKAPPANDGGGPPHGSPEHDAAVDRDIKDMKSKGYTDIRKNQAQVDANGNKVGNNRPDSQGTSPKGKREIREQDRTQKNSQRHGDQIRANDPAAKCVLSIYC